MFLDRFSRWISGTESKISFTEQIVRLLAWLGVLSAGTFASWKAAMTDWIAAYGPAGWVLFGILSAIVTALAFRITAAAIDALADARLKLSYTHRDVSANPLSDSFEKEIVNIGDFYSPGPMIYKDKVFRNCEIRGPGTIFIDGNSRISSCKLHISIIETTDPIFPDCIVVFINPTFLNCSMYRITILGVPGLREVIEAGSNRPKVNSLPQ
jgi:hypothetical protein